MKHCRNGGRIVVVLLLFVIGSSRAVVAESSDCCPLCPRPTAVAGGSRTICLGATAALSGSGVGGNCSWSPTIGVSNPSSCTTMASPTETTSYVLTVTNSFGCHATSEPVTITVTSFPEPVITAPVAATPGQTNLTGSVPNHADSRYEWTIFNGSITSGQGTNFITFSAASTVVPLGGLNVGLVLSVTETDRFGCRSRRGGAAVSLDATSATCSTGPTTLCLNGSRFQVQVGWSVPAQGTNGVGTAIPLTSDTGAFWFFNPDNVELVIKVLDGRAFNGMYWVFYGALSNVRYTITVTDTQTGNVKTYLNPEGQLGSVADTAAF